MDDLSSGLLSLVSGVIGGVVGAWYSAGVEKRRAISEQDQHAHYLAIRVVTTLDPFIAACASVANDDGVAPGHQVYEPSDLSQQAATPELVLPTEVDWKSIDQAFAYELLSFPNSIAHANSQASDASYYGDGPEDYFDTRQRAYIELGLKAESFAQRLRREHGLPARGNTGWNPIESINRAKAEFAEWDEKRRVARDEEERRLAGLVVPPPPPAADV